MLDELVSAMIAETQSNDILLLSLAPFFLTLY